MNAEDEQNCDYTGSQYHVDLYRSRNTDHSNLKYSKSKSAGQSLRDINRNFTVTNSKQSPTTVAFVLTNSTPLPKYDVNSTLRNREVIKIENITANVVIEEKNINSNITRLNDTVFDALRQLFDNQFTGETFSCKR